jgi:hypothetical protein
MGAIASVFLFDHSARASDSVPCSTPLLSLPHKGGGNRVARIFITSCPMRGIV